MTLDVKACAAAIFRLNPEYFSKGYPRHTQPECQALLVNAHGNYNKYTPILFQDPKNANPDKFLKTVVLKAALFGKSSISSTTSAGPRTKSKIWELRDMSPGMVSAAAVVAIFLLSGDTEFQKKGDKTSIPYNQYHDYYRQQLLTGGSWAHGVLSFFNDALFPDSSDSAFESPADASEDIDYEDAFERAMEMGLPPPILPGALSPPSCLSSLPPSAAAAPVAAPSDSILAAMQPHLNLDIWNAPAPNSVVPPMPNSEPEPVPEMAPAVPGPALEVQVPAVKPKSKLKCKGKAVDMEHAAVGGDEQVGTGSTAGRKTRARSNK
ncbi:hypothetical protein PAXRUDRAFT_13238 [Paxillus rubicundulus Ve08.2h10]|uniref:Unplaced genomic scaffold scaffold_458, whole genome shotgun sequence n=1 Tax=Paxillus rubicundulus Ve08.2h10 TaxID=930991 RepID=A0A0D0DLY1_9AGAM|nr:hypothetical protein PAXRUDRAFT_13238 [Paxillus rubicundulus Ve08.2h10]